MILRRGQHKLRQVHATDVLDADQESWMVAYADMITLLFIFFALLLSISVISRTKFEMMSQQMNQEYGSNLSELKEKLDQEIRNSKLENNIETQLTDEGLVIQFSEATLFSVGQADISARGQEVLTAFATTVRDALSKYHMAVEGHTDDVPIHTAAFPSNWWLSSARSVTVLQYLASKGLDEKKMMVRAYADTRPLRSEDALGPESLRNKNRRVTLLVF